MIRRSLASAALIVVLGAGCQSQPPAPTIASAAPTDSAHVRGPLPSRSEVERQQQAIVAALATGAGDGSGLLSIFPKSVGSEACDIHGGGPYPGVVVPATCHTEVEANGVNDVVKFTEKWDATEFHLSGDAGSGQLSATWSFLVTPTGGVTALPFSGSFPPQLVR